MFRKHPTELMHSDTWTGANPNWCAVHIFLMGDIKKLFDPKNIMNPGKLVPDKNSEI